IGELSDAIVVARGGVKIGRATRVTVIAREEVEISFADAVLVVAAGPIRVAHELPTSPESAGVYVTRRALSISHARDPVVYAAGGADFSHSRAFTAFNTDFAKSPVERSVFVAERLFRAEPVREQRAPVVLG